MAERAGDGRGPFILGAGRVGTALAIALSRAGLPAAGMWTRSAPSAERARRLTGGPCWQGALPEQVGQARVVQQWLLTAAQVARRVSSMAARAAQQVR